jgi:hypothetical protein
MGKLVIVGVGVSDQEVTVENNNSYNISNGSERGANGTEDGC